MYVYSLYIYLSLLNVQADVEVFDSACIEAGGAAGQARAHVASLGCSAALVTMPWFLCLFLNVLPTEATLSPAVCLEG